MAEPVGLLALQGDFERHQQALARLGAATRLVRRADELRGCAALVLPGGESTTLSRLIDRNGLRAPLRDFAAARPVLATCAGMIMLAQRLDDDPASRHGVEPLGLLDCLVRRNGYGRQVDSFQDQVDLSGLDGAQAPYPGVFIRAPRILEVGPRAEVIGRRGDEPVALRQGLMLALAFHPELTADPRPHRALLALAERL